MPRVKEELLTALNNACNSNTSAKSLCTLAGLSTDGSQATKRARLAAIVEGPKGRQRPGWLDLVLQVFEAGARSIDDIDASTLEPGLLAEGSCTILLDLLERLPLGGLQRFLPFSVLPDLERNEVDDSVVFSISSLPSMAEINTCVGTAEMDGTELQNKVQQLSAELQTQEERIRARILAEVRDGKISLPSEQSVAAQRDSFAFPIHPDRFVLLGTETDDQGVRLPVCGPSELLDTPVPLSQDKFFELMFDSKLKGSDSKAIQRRNLMPADVFCDAPVLPATHVAAIGGTSSSAFKTFEELRIKQQKALHPVQAQFRALAHGSEALLDLLQLSSGGASDSNLLERAVSSTEHLVAALSDSILLASVELSEWERQKQECYVRGRSGVGEWKLDRDSGRKTRRFMQVDELATTADAERKRAKDFKSDQKPANNNNRRKPGQQPQLPADETRKRAEQSKRDKARAAAEKAKAKNGSSTPHNQKQNAAAPPRPKNE